VPWWGLVVLALLSGLLLAPLAVGFALGYRRRIVPLDRLARLVVATLFVERIALAVALWLATFDRSFWILVGASLLVLMTRLFLRGLGRRPRRAGDTTSGVDIR
jgi:CBS domain containing-hemolysin-like protein